MRNTPLPTSSFAELAVELSLIAHEQARAVEIMETQMVQLPDHLRKIRDYALSEEKKKVVACVGLLNLVKRLIPFEEHIRQLLNTEDELEDVMKPVDEEASAP